jgi:hypothetical protein
MDVITPPTFGVRIPTSFLRIITMCEFCEFGLPRPLYFGNVEQVYQSVSPLCAVTQAETSNLLNS